MSCSPFPSSGLRLEAVLGKTMNRPSDDMAGEWDVPLEARPDVETETRTTLEVLTTGIASPRYNGLRGGGSIADHLCGVYASRHD